MTSHEVQTDGEIFRRLCPNSFTEPPKTNPPELDLNMDCNGAIKEATRLAIEFGSPSLSRGRIIDTWDVQYEGDTWYARYCSAKLLFSDGEEAN